MAETLFLVEGQSNVRIRFKKEGNVVSGAVVLYSDGKSREYKREID